LFGDSGLVHAVENALKLCQIRRVFANWVEREAGLDCGMGLVKSTKLREGSGQLDHIPERLLELRIVRQRSGRVETLHLTLASAKPVDANSRPIALPPAALMEGPGQRRVGAVIRERPRFRRLV
jgi:hypothetical protein